MSDTALPQIPALRLRGSAALGLIGAIAWRNLWRNRRRTLLSAASIAFSVALLLFAMAMQSGAYRTMIDNATRLLDGHVQVQRPGYLDDPRIGNVIEDVADRLAIVRATPGVVGATPRIAAFVLVSGDDRSYGAQLLGVDPSGEQVLSSLPSLVAAGRYLGGGAEAYAGRVLARNIGASVGDQIVILGTTATGGMAALAVTLVGTFSSGATELDRQLIEVPYAAVADAFEMSDSAHAIVVRTTSVERADAVADALGKRLPGNDLALTWRALLPDLHQAILFDRASSEVVYGVLAAVVSIGVLNGFLMTVFERTREFGMLLAMGMRSSTLIGMLQLEALLLSSIGCAVGVAIGAPLVLWCGHTGISLGDDAGAALRVYHLADRLYPVLAAPAVLKPVVLMVLCTQLAAWVPALRVRRIQPVEALRAA